MSRSLTRRRTAPSRRALCAALAGTALVTAGVWATADDSGTVRAAGVVEDNAAVRRTVPHGPPAPLTAPPLASPFLTAPALTNGPAVHGFPGTPPGGHAFFPPFPPLAPAPAAPARPAGGGAGEWAAPVTGYAVSASYGTPGDWAAGHHTGVDFVTPVGTPVHAVGPGTVILAEYSGDYGNAVMVAMDDGHYTLYAHLSEIAVTTGRRVTGGTTIGASGNTGNTTGPHLHFEVRAGRAYGTDVDPVAYLAGHGVTV
ncbi:M23 family metallopeptidase [Streptomyces sp. RFCAC02]|uniref:M23 family metallopeptidase n=1 Tax=Streptomyces sp. RFCAC02 TaxID=2499143 RepID=UPI001021DDF3|nr:M23 family metallopeptidase [Streptomyces sp. RFCAC02]